MCKEKVNHDELSSSATRPALQTQLTWAAERSDCLSQGFTISSQGGMIYDDNCVSHRGELQTQSAANQHQSSRSQCREDFLEAGSTRAVPGATNFHKSC